MNPKVFKNDVDRLRHGVKVRNYLIGGLMVVCAFMAMSVYSLIGKQQIRLVPPNIGSGVWVSGEAVSESYLHKVGYYVLHLGLDVTPANIEYQQAMFLQLVEPSRIPELRKHFLAIAEKIKKDESWGIFSPGQYKVDVNGLKVAFTGTLTTIVGGRPTSDTQKTYLIEFGINDATGKIYVKDFRETNWQRPFDDAVPAAG